jgi:hypothetical protein
MPNYQKPLILLGHFDFDPAKRPYEKIFLAPFSPPAVRGLTHPRAPFRAFSRAAIHTPARTGQTRRAIIISIRSSEWT